MTQTLRILTALTLASFVAFGSGCDKHEEGKADHGHDKAAHGAEKPGKDKAEHAAERRITLTAAELETAGVKVAELAPQEFAQPIVVTATIEANQDRIAHVSPRVSSRIVRVSANLGDTVRQGQPLAMLDSMEVGDAHSAYLKARTEASLARRNFDRAEKLQAEQIIAQKDYLRARAELEIADAALRAASDRLRLLGVAADASKGATAVSVFPLTSPFSGTIIEKHAILGELAQPDKSLFTVADLSVLWIEANVFERDLAKVRVGSKASITVEAYPGEIFNGRVAHIGNVVSKETRTVPTRIEVPQHAGKLKPEMFATAAIDTAARTPGLFVPDEAVVLMQGQSTIFIEDKGAFEARAVETGERLNGRVQLKSGAKPGERVVVAGAYALKAKVLKSQIGDTH